VIFLAQVETIRREKFWRRGREEIFSAAAQNKRTGVSGE
jgi:hypothetical protein